MQYGGCCYATLQALLIKVQVRSYLGNTCLQSINYALTNKTVIAYDKIPIVIHRTFSNVIPEIRFRHLVPWVEVHSEIKRAMWEVRTVHPLTVNPPAVQIITSGRYALASSFCAVVFSVISRITLAVFQTKAGFMTLSYLLAIVFP